MNCEQSYKPDGLSNNAHEAAEKRPGLPLDVAALVDSLDAEKVGIQLVNLSASETRCLIVQAGGYGEHNFTTVNFDEVTLDYEGVNPGQRVRAARQCNEASTAVEGKHFAVELPPMTSIQLDCGLERRANDPSYAFPWHGDAIPVPFS